MKFELTPRQVEGIRKRFAATVDLRKEYISAREYVENIHEGRPYKNLGKFFWNWCRMAEKIAAKRNDDTPATRPRGEAAKLAADGKLCPKCGRLWKFCDCQEIPRQEGRGDA